MTGVRRVLFRSITVDENDALQRFGRVKIEATSFTISEPTELLAIAPLIYEEATDEQKKQLASEFGVKPFAIETITLERIFVDKLFAAEAYTRRSHDEHKAFEAAKHIYDLAVLSSNGRICNLMNSEGGLYKLLDIRLREEQERRDGIPNVKPCEFTFFEDAFEDPKIQTAY